jgi:RNA polymerase sigma-70 factor (ECF subfamily)
MPPITASDYGSIGSTSSGLIARAKAHDQEAWRRLVRLYGPLIDFWIRRAGLPAADTEDAFQEVFQSVARGIEGFRKDPSGGTFRGWLRTITRSKVTDSFRRRGMGPEAIGGSTALKRWEGLAAEEPALSSAEEKEAMRGLWARGLALIRAEFEERTWEMFWRLTVDGHLAKDVADEFGVTPSAVRLAKSRVLRRLREELEE